METEFSRGFEMLLYFVDLYLQISGQGDYEKIDVGLVFNKDMAIKRDGADSKLQQFTRNRIRRKH